MPFASNRIAGGWYGACAGGCPCAAAMAHGRTTTHTMRARKNWRFIDQCSKRETRAKWRDSY